MTVKTGEKSAEERKTNMFAKLTDTYLTKMKSRTPRRLSLANIFCNLKAK